jgi:hypothetical protein
MQSNSLGLLIICGFFVALLGMVAFAVYIIRKGNAQKQQIATSLGFAPVADSQALLERLAFVTGRNRPELLRLTNVFRRGASGGEVYFYSLHRRDIKNPTFGNPSKSSKTHMHPLELDAFAFVAPIWKFPRFVIVPRLAGDGLLAGLANQMGEKLVEVNAQRLEFPHIPSFDKNYFVALYESQADFTFPDGFLRLLAGTPGLQLGARGDTLTVSLVSVSGHTEPELQKLYKTGLQLVREISNRPG